MILSPSPPPLPLPQLTGIPTSFLRDLKWVKRIKILPHETTELWEKLCGVLGRRRGEDLFVHSPGRKFWGKKSDQKVSDPKENLKKKIHKNPL